MAPYMFYGDGNSRRGEQTPLAFMLPVNDPARQSRKAHAIVKNQLAA